MLHLIVLGAARPTSFRPPALSRASLRGKTQLDLEALHAALSSNGTVTHGKKVFTVFGQLAPRRLLSAPCLWMP